MKRESLDVMVRLAPVIFLVFCLTFGTVSIAFGEQSAGFQDINSVTAEVTVLESQTPATPVPPAVTPPTTPQETPAPTPVVSPAELSVKTPIAAPAKVEEQSKPPESGSEVSRGSSTARSVITTSLRFLGSPYRYGGNTARGFDCSGFVSHVFSLVDIKLPRSSREQAKMGTHVDKEKLIPADLVFFKTGGSSRINHVGIYLGDSRFIHSSTTRGIVITSLNEKYYQKAYYGARRILE